MTGVDDPRAELSRLLEDDPADLYENAPCGYLSTLPDGSIVKVNRTFCSWTGRPADELLGSRFQDLLAIGGRVFHETHMAPLLRMQGAVREIALEVLRVDGSVLPCLLNAVEVRDDDGTPLLVRATLFEATARRRYERELLAAQRTAEESEARSRTLQAVVSDLAAALSVQDVATVIVERSRRAMDAVGAALLLVDEADEPQLRLGRAEGLPDSLLHELRLAAGDRLALELAEGVRVIAVDERLRQVQPGVAEAMLAAGLTELVVVPVSADGRGLGVLVLGLGAHGDLISLAEPATARPPHPADVELLSTVGRQAGQALERAQLHEETARQAERAAFLLDAARLMAAAADVDEVVDRLAGLAVQRLADVCFLDLASERGLYRVAARHRDPERQPLVDVLHSHGQAQRRSSPPSAVAYGQGRTQWISEFGDELLRAVARDDDELRPEPGAAQPDQRAAGRRRAVAGRDHAARRPAPVPVHRGRRRGRRAARPAGGARRRQGTALRARRAHLARAAGQPAAAPAARRPGAGHGRPLPRRHPRGRDRRRLLRRGRAAR
jgi:PAS domain S-box-containing protein